MAEQSHTPMIDPSELGRVVWHSSEEDGGPDVGMTLGLGEGVTLWLGELADQTVEECGAKRRSSGWWIATFQGDGAEIVAEVSCADAARDLFDRIAAIAKATGGAQ